MRYKIIERKINLKVNWQFCIALILILLTGIYMNYYMFDEIMVADKPLRGFPRELGNWKNTGYQSISNDVLDILKVDDYLLRNYRNNDGMTSSLYIGYYQTHRRFAEIHTPEHCQAGGGWEILSKKNNNLILPGTEDSINFVEAVYEKDQEKMVFLYWYFINGNYITNFFKYKINVVINSLLYHRSDASFVRITVPIIDDDADGAIVVGENFLMEAVPVIRKYLQ